MGAVRAWALAALVAAACGGAGVSPAPAPDTIRVTLTDTAIRLDQDAVPAGIVKLRFANGGTMPHSATLLHTDLPHDRIPPNAADAGRMEEPGLLRVTGLLKVGQGRDLEVRLAPGTYVLICNEPAHYVVGMHTAFTVR